MYEDALRDLQEEQVVNKLLEEKLNDQQMVSPLGGWVSPKNAIQRVFIHCSSFLHLKLLRVCWTNIVIR